MADKFDVHDNAKSRLKNTSLEIYRSILVIAAELAKRDNSDEVQTYHIEEARQMISPKQRNTRIREFAKIVGGAMIGAFPPGFYSAFPHDNIPLNPGALLVYTAFGIVGTALVVWGFR